MTRTSLAAHVTKRATLHTVASTRTRHAGNYMREVPGMGRRIDILGVNKEALSARTLRASAHSSTAMNQEQAT